MFVDSVQAYSDDWILGFGRLRLWGEGWGERIRRRLRLCTGVVRCIEGDRQTDRQTDKQTERFAYHNDDEVDCLGVE